MYEGQLVFSQLTDHLPFHVFRKCVRRYGGNRYVKSFPCITAVPRKSPAGSVTY